MNGRTLARGEARGRAAAPVRLVHLGLGNFFRAHQCWYTEHASDRSDWGIAAFPGRSDGPLVGQLNEQAGLYTLVSRGGDRDTCELVGSLTRAHAATDHRAWLDYFRAPQLSAVTITVTEAGYLRGADGGLDVARAEVQADLRALRGDLTARVHTAPARLVAGLAARRQADAGPLALVPCDNTPGNGALAGRVVHDLAERLEPELAAWLTASVAVVTTMVDRITPRTTADDVRTVRDCTGFADRCPVVAEPFKEWVLSGSFPNQRPRWEHAGATFTDDVTPYEHRKLWLLNGAHSLLAYAGSIRGHRTVAEAIGDEACRGWVEAWWAAASRHLDRPAEELTAYTSALIERFANARMRDRLDRIAADGSQKLPIRILPVLRAERASGHLPHGATRVLAAWVCHLRGLGAPISDTRADELVPLAQGPLARAARQVLTALDPQIATDTDVLAAVVEQCEQLARSIGRWPSAQRADRGD